MRNHSHSCFVAVAGGLVLALFSCPLLQADQIVALVDEHGHKIYINTGEKSTRVDWVTRSFRLTRPAAGAQPVPEVDRLVKETEIGRAHV
jgi:hypothetical protein